MVSKDYILDIAKNRKMRSFFIRDGRGDVVFMADTPAGAEDRFNELKHFLDHNTGVFKVEMRDTYGKGQYAQARQRQSILIGDFEIMLDKPKTQGVSGLDIMGEVTGGISGYQVIRGYEEQVRELSNQNIRLQNKIDLLEDKLERVKEMHDRELADAKSSDKRIMNYLNQFGSVLNPMPGSGNINGTETKTETKTMNTDKEKLVAAVNRLIAADDNLAEHLTKLADIAENDPGTYQMAIGFLNK